MSELTLRAGRGSGLAYPLVPLHDYLAPSGSLISSSLTQPASTLTSSVTPSLDLSRYVMLTPSPSCPDDLTDPRLAHTEAFAELALGRSG